MDWTQHIISACVSSGVAFGIVKLCVKKIAEDAIKENNNILEKTYTTKENMQKERKDLLNEVERKFLTIYAFREFEKRIDNKFDDNSKRFDEQRGMLEHITDLLIDLKK